MSLLQRRLRRCGRGVYKILVSRLAQTETPQQWQGESLAMLVCLDSIAMQHLHGTCQLAAAKSG